FNCPYDTAYLHSFPTRRSSDLIMFGTEALDRDIQQRMAKHSFEISRARKAPFQEFYAWRAKERSQSALANTESESKRRGNQSGRDRKSTRLNSSHVAISYAVFC